MTSHDRLRRRGERSDSEPVTDTPRRSPDVASILALQRSAGNQAVLQRLIHDQADNALGVPKAYADERIGWNDNKHYVDHEPTPKDPKLSELVERPVVKGHAVSGVGIDFGKMVGHADIKTKVEDRVPDWPEDAADIKREAGTIAEDPYRVLKLFKGTQLNTKEDLKHTWAQSPSDYLPGEPDLPGAKKSLKGTKIPNDKDGATYWTYACVLIALVKADANYTNTMRIAGLKKAPASLDAAVQALHDHYMGPQVKTQYDDSSARLGVMRDWGWSRVYSGNTKWEELATRTSLAPGTYIFDIKGHTVLVRVKKEVKRGEPIVGELSATFEPESDGQNFKVGTEFNFPITAIYQRN
jgi:hypothetical protein